MHYRAYYHTPRARHATYALLTVFLLAAMMPFVGIFLTSFKTIPELREGPFALPETWNWRNYVDAWEGAQFGRYFRSSVIVVIPVVVIASLLSTMSGYAFGMIRFWATMSCC